ncbi:Arsenate reductase [Sodalis glossinidius str. 'morsitans']|uniref:Arsenate reductase n=1 Tax=Sodalis glossinidius (strain morsitans) TaxID=343509 RepID=Q2NR81_SODGM|nr:arsenate reductase (glutaredoxin) [Sodalis glossinidius]BAE75344.1 arsenate reductase [Sodalis glossinidius str. 'morsitans']CRL46367.1 Arsenate reductase [Sodalis glossinidius str. 'morsitans']
MASITIYHNPACSTSRKTLALIRDSGVEPTVILYLKQPPSRAQLKEMLNAMGLSARELLRAKEELYRQERLDADNLSEDVLIEEMLKVPILINRPIVVSPLGTRLCRPAETVLDILPPSQ